MSVNKLPHMRKHYEAAELNEANTPDTPLPLFHTWFTQAHESPIIEANAMTLATASKDGVPSARIVLLKEMTNEGFVFYTNYLSNKGKNLAENPNASLLFFGDILERQVRIEGTVQKVSEQTSNDYFYQRPSGSQIGAIISPQSQKIDSKDQLLQAYTALEKSTDIKKPDHWGGYILMPRLIEFWQGRPNRLHDRIVYELNQDAKWHKYRLAP